MTDYIIEGLREHPELAIFLTLAVGFLVGRVRIGTFTIGNVVGTLLAGVVVGQIGIEVHPLVKIVFFDLFLFATGYKVGPQFFRGLGRHALAQVALTVVLCVTSLVTTLVAAKAMGYDAGTAAGLMAGAFTESTVIGTAGDTISRLDLPDATKKAWLDNIPVAYAVSYLVGTGFVVWFLSSLGPRLLGIDLKAESRALEARMAAAPVEQPGAQSAYREWDIRAYALAATFADHPVSHLEDSFSPERVHVERIRRGDRRRRRGVRGAASGAAGAGHHPRHGGGGQGAARLPRPYGRRGRHQPGPGGRAAASAGRAARSRCRAGEADSRRRGDPVHGRHSREPRRSPADRRRAA
jgi:putative transport protein